MLVSEEVKESYSNTGTGKSLIHVWSELMMTELDSNSEQWTQDGQQQQWRSQTTQQKM